MKERSKNKRKFEIMLKERQKGALEGSSNKYKSAICGFYEIQNNLIIESPYCGNE